MSQVIDPDIFEPEETGNPNRQGHDDPATEYEGYVISSLGEADWALRKIAQARAVVQERQDVASAELDRIRAWVLKASELDIRTIEFFSGLLQRWHGDSLEADPIDADAWKDEPNKTIKLPSGELRAKRTPPTVAIDDAVFLAECDRPDLVSETTTYKPIHAEVKKAVLEDGEVLPGVAIVPASVSWKAVTD